MCGLRDALYVLFAGIYKLVEARKEERVNVAEDDGGVVAESGRHLGLIPD